MTDPNKLFHRAPASRTLTPALIAVAIAWAIVLVLHVVYLLRDLLWMIDDGFDALPDALGDFGESAIVEPLLFFLGAGALLVLILPILSEAKLSLVLMRAAVASAGGFIVLTVKGLIEAIVELTRFGFAFGYFVNDWIGWPLVKSFDLAALLVIGAVVSWLIANRRTAAAPADAPASGAG